MSFDRAASRHFRRRVAAVIVGATLLAGSALAVSPPASATVSHAHDPIGAVTSLRSVSGGLLMTGWAVDPDAPGTNAMVIAIRNGWASGPSATTSVANPTIRKKYHTGPTPGFTLKIPVSTTTQTVCLAVWNIAAGYHRALRCVTMPLATKLTTVQRFAHNPVGKVTGFTVSATGMRVRGYATDPDWRTHKLVVVLYVNGRSTATVMSHTYPDPRPAGVGRLSAFDISVPVSRGSHLGCVWVVNVGIGQGNTFLGCRTGDTRGAVGKGAVTAPALNKKVVAEAKRHIGQPYVWGAEGPKKFDCSGLVQYSYGKFGYTTPRVSEDQFLKARAIPASRAVPGDLVLYHDQVGDVYHVGIYVSPGRTVAAIDEAEGVNYQNIWDPSSTTYGSFTHT